MEEVKDFLLKVYRAAREHDPDEFSQMVLARVLRSTDSDSALWGDGRRVSDGYAIVPTRLQTRNLDADFLLEWARVVHQDPAVPLLLANPARALRLHVPSFYAGKPELAHVGTRFGLGSMSVVALEGLGSNQMHWLSLFRSDPDSICSDAQRDWIEAVMPHLTEAWRINLALASPSQGADDCHQVGVAETSSGLLIRADEAFLGMLGAEWSEFDGLHIPSPLVRIWREHAKFSFNARSARIEGRTFGELVYLSARLKTRVECLTPRQLDIAELYAQGLSSKEIARRRGLSPATVRNHLARIYEGLEVHGRQALNRRLDGLGATSEREEGG